MPLALRVDFDDAGCSPAARPGRMAPLGDTHPWTNRRAARMRRTAKDATVRAFHHDDLESLKVHVLSFMTAYNFSKHLKALKWRTPLIKFWPYRTLPP